MIDKSELERICGEPFDVISEITLKSFCYINFAGKTKKINIKIGRFAISNMICGICQAALPIGRSEI